ncbi:hypothetical protein DICSQDRAFT_83967 [Dichomitus squalens LYAD-421 SS1]|uniref:uncharacterized protein n=1 Tax=Dichomitus squalens (strain LYAD-421) TaxID=732165 RepID=UPI0004414462|nr:uncharacterized protein DICSQDRAFT_83967 [Dichomitus squalens LYAD-421 SS1]EJF63073.1 hypothetical protein DICSQDRAFT_83967 [Dichomitus squalens LYAD-421 SS1]
MPRIRKKTSKRQSIAKRERVKKQVKESRKKKTKEAKKNPQWKSKHKKDPGIPNNFPYKDQILAEVAEQRRLAAEEKQRRKDEKKAAKAQAADGSDAEDDEAAFDGVKAIAGRRALEAEAEEGGDADEEMAEEGEGDDVPVLINPDLPNLKVVLDAADVVVEVLDARDPLAARSAHVEEVAKDLGKRVLLVLNKVDACPREAVEAWATTLRREHPTVLFRSSSACLPVSPADAGSARVKGKGKERERADDAWGLDSLTALLQQWAKEKAGDGPLTLAVVGVTNVGKTAFVNSLLRKAALQTYKLTSSATDFSPTTTTHPQEVSIDLEDGESLRVIDTPGLLWHHVEDLPDEEAARIRARDILLRNRGHIERLKDPYAVMSELVSRSSREDLMLLYNLPIFVEGDANAFLASVARANNYIKKKGNLDLAGAARTVLRDWSHGKFARYTVPSAAQSPDSAPQAEKSLEDAYAKDESVLSKLATRKELRKAGGLVKLRAGEVDTRRVVLDAGYFVSSSDDGMDGDEEDGGAVDDADEVGLEGEESDEGDYVSDEVEDSDEEDDEDEEDEDEGVDELESPPPRGKRKRILSKAPARPAKRVAFAVEPKNTKQARSAAGAKGAVTAASKAQLKARKPKLEPKAAKKAVKAAATNAAPAKKVANAASSKKSAASSPKDGEAAYDFKQFF